LRAALAVASVALAACAAPPPGPATLSTTGARLPLPVAFEGLVSKPRRIDFLLLGEVHDHPLHHDQRLAWLTELARRGRFVLAMEQIDADRQGDLDAAVAAALASPAPAGAARVVAEAAGFDFRGWHWEHYRPFFELALRERLPLVASNLSRAEASSIARGQPHPLTATSPPDWGETERAVLAADIREGHCGLLPERAVAPMALAQQARDARMARVLAETSQRTGLPVALVAGNGHVRRDVGVPRHLAALRPEARIVAVGFLESDDPAEAVRDRPPETTGTAGAGAPTALARSPRRLYDLEVWTPPQARTDPCEDLRRRFAPRQSSNAASGSAAGRAITSAQ
jgi:uncharacterized iron-regulated protein